MTVSGAASVWLNISKVRVHVCMHVIVSLSVYHLYGSVWYAIPHLKHCALSPPVCEVCV